MNHRVVLITAKPRVVSTGAETTIRMAGFGNTAPYYYRGEHWRAGVATRPRFRAAIGFDETGWTGGSVPATGAMGFAPSTPGAMTDLAALYWPDASILVETVSEGGSDFDTVLDGVIAGVSIEAGKLTFTVADGSVLLGKPVTDARFAGTGGIEGDADIEGRLKRRSWGRVFNVEGRILLKADNIWEFGDPSQPLQSFEAVKDKGREGAMTVVAWAGSIAATLAALIASTPPAGGASVAPSIACVKWWMQPAGPLTADMKGEIGGGYVETGPEIAAAVVAARSSFSVANVSDATDWRGGVCGLHIDSENETIATALDRALLGISLLWLLDPDGTIRFRELDWVTAAEEIASDRVSRQSVLPPMKSRRVGYQRNYRQQSDGEIAGVLLWGDVEGEDKPEDNATQTDPGNVLKDATFDPERWLLGTEVERVAGSSLTGFDNAVRDFVLKIDGTDEVDDNERSARHAKVPIAAGDSVMFGCRIARSSDANCIMQIRLSHYNSNSDASLVSHDVIEVEVADLPTAGEYVLFSTTVTVPPTTTKSSLVLRQADAVPPPTPAGFFVADNPFVRFSA